MAISKQDMVEFAKYKAAQAQAGVVDVTATIAASPAASPAPVQAIEASAGSALAVTVAGQSLATSDLRTFASGKRGWNLTGKVVVGGQRVQVSGNFVILRKET